MKKFFFSYYLFFNIEGFVFMLTSVSTSSTHKVGSRLWRVYFYYTSAASCSVFLHRPWAKYGSEKQSECECTLNWNPRPSEQAGSAKETLHFLGWRLGLAVTRRMKRPYASYSIPPHPPLPPFPSSHYILLLHNHPMLRFAILPPTGCLIASTKLVISHRLPLDVWHCFWHCRHRLMSLVVDLFSASMRGSLTACQSRSLAADLMKALKHALAKTPFAIDGETICHFITPLITHYCFYG